MFVHLLIGLKLDLLLVIVNSLKNYVMTCPRELFIVFEHSECSNKRMTPVQENYLLSLNIVLNPLKLYNF